jgi:hypothetical protein
MPPKKRRAPAKKAAEPVSDEESVPPPKKRGRPKKQVSDPQVAATSEDDIAPPPAKKPRGRPKKAAVVEVSDEEQPNTTTTKRPAKGKKVAAKPADSDDNGVIPELKNAKGKQIAIDDDEDEQDVKSGTSPQLRWVQQSLYCQKLSMLRSKPIIDRSVLDLKVSNKTSSQTAGKLTQPLFKCL